jgi:hypothetical protein
VNEYWLYEILMCFGFSIFYGLFNDFFTLIAKNSGLSPLIVLINLGVVGFSVWFFVIYITPFKSLNQYRLVIIFSCSFLGDHLIINPLISIGAIQVYLKKSSSKN